MACDTEVVAGALGEQSKQPALREDDLVEINVRPLAAPCADMVGAHARSAYLSPGCSGACGRGGARNGARAGLGRDSARSSGDSTKASKRAERALDRALARLHGHPDGPPGIVVVVQRGRRLTVHREGVADLAHRSAIKTSDHMRLASVAKAFSGAVALSLVADHRLTLSDTIGRWLPSLPSAWSAVTLRELLQHTSGIPDFSKETTFLDALRASLLVPPTPPALLTYVADKRPSFTPGSRFRYSNSDNIIVGLMVEAATGHTYESELRERVFGPLGLTQTSLPSGAGMLTPFVHGYEVDPPKAAKDISELFTAGWTWASGGIVSTPRDANAFVRAYVRGATTNGATRAAQFSFVPGDSEPPGPGENSAGLAVFRYRTRCGTVYGHTGNTAGYTQFIAASADGSRSMIVSISAQITPTANEKRFAELRGIYTLAVCAALA